MKGNQDEGCFPTAVRRGLLPAIHEPTAQIARIAPITANEIVMGTSSQREASILKATNISMAPRP
jgi:hypothetical protein